jgi:hypothetical protein
MKINRWLQVCLRLAAVLFLLAAVLGSAPRHPVRAAGTRYYVRGNGGSVSNSGLSWNNAFKYLQQALTVANSGDEIWVAGGVYYPDDGGPYPLDSRNATFTLEDGVAIYGGFAGTETLLSQRDFTVNLTILSGDVDNNDFNGDGNFIAESIADIVGSNAYHVVTTSGNASTAILDGFVITAGKADGNTDPLNKGGGVYAYQSSATLRNLAFSASYAGSGGGLVGVDCPALSLMKADFVNNYAVFVGGGLALINSALTLTDVMLGGNEAGSSGGGMDNSNSTISINNAIFTDNLAPLGGAMANRFNSRVDLVNGTFSSNYASSGGGGIYNQNSHPTLSNVTFTDNRSLVGGGMYNQNSNPTLLFNTFRDNQADFGGGLSNDNSRPVIQFGLFEGNYASDKGGAIHNLNGSNLSLLTTTVRNNQAAAGGGMYNYLSNPNLTSVDFQNNRADSASLGGGGMFNYSSSPVLSRVTFSGNTASNAGGGMYNYLGSHPKLTDVTFSGNTAQNGGGMRNHSGNNQPELNRVTFVGNEAGFGGGMSNDNSAPRLTNVTFSGNYASHFGGGMLNYQSSPLLWNVTFYQNASEDPGGGLYNSNGGLPFLRNVILAGSVNGDCVNGPGGVVAGEYTLVQDSGANACGAVNGFGFTVGVDPELGPLASNGGFTQTHALLKDSPAIDAVLNNNCPNEDQRGVTRPQKAYCDVGAVEYTDPLLVFLPLVRK